MSLTAPSALEQGTELPTLRIYEIHKIFGKAESAVVSVFPQAAQETLSWYTVPEETELLLEARS